MLIILIRKKKIQKKIYPSANFSPPLHICPFRKTHLNSQTKHQQTKYNYAPQQKCSPMLFIFPVQSRVLNFTDYSL